MKDHLLVLPDPDPSDLAVVRAVAREFGWQVNGLVPPDRIAAVLSKCATGESWPATVRNLRDAYPEARIITCHGFRDFIDWGQMYDLNTFHAIRTPMQEEEVRQSLGFLWEAEQRSRARQPISILSRNVEPRRAIANSRTFAAG